MMKNDINEIWLIYAPESDVLVPSDQFARLLEEEGIVKITKMSIKQTLVKYYTESPISMETVDKVDKKLRAENFIVTEFEHVGDTARFRLF